MPQSNKGSQRNLTHGEERLPYMKPSITRVELSLEETLAAGCKTETDIICTGPPSPSFDIGS